MFRKPRHATCLFTGSRRLLVAVGIVVGILSAGSLASAEELGAGNVSVDRFNWWPFAVGPHYGEVIGEERFDPRVIRLPVGSFDTRGPGLAVPKQLRLADPESASGSAPWLVQLRGPITEAKKQALRARGVRLYTYFPSNTFVVKTRHPGKLGAMPEVLWAGPFHPAYRIEPLLGQAPTADPVVGRNERIYVRALLFEPSERPAVIATLTAAGARVDRTATFVNGGWPDRIYFEAEPETILDAARLHQVRWVEEVSRAGFVMNSESKVVVQSGSVSNGTPYWDAGVDGSTQVVGDMDSGMDVDTILLSDTQSAAGTPGPSHRKVKAYTAWGGGNLETCSGTSGYAHGTNTAQCAVGNRTDFGLGGEFEGIAKQASIVFQDIGPTDFFACLLGQIAPPSSLVAMYDEVRSHGGHLSNGSFSICSGYGSHASDADQYMWDNKDFLMFFSAGNGGNGLVCPGTGKNVIAAGGHYQDPFFDFYGATGPGPDGRMGPTIMAPACDFAAGNPEPAEFNYNTSTSLQSSDNDITGTPEANVNQGSCGTSFSSPYVMGAAALIRDYFEKGFHPSGAANASDGFAPSGAMVKAVLLNSGDLMTCCGSFMESTLSYGQGMGRLNLSRTLVIDGDSRTPPGMRAVDRGMSDGLATGEFFEETIEITDTTRPLRATVNWTDRVGSALVNDLRLTVTGPAGTAAQTYHGGNFSGEFTLSESTGGTANDQVNPFEAVFVQPSELVAGTWTVRVDGINVPQGDPAFGNTQPFALVVSGGFSSSVVREISGNGSASPLEVTSSSGSEVGWQWEEVAEPGVTYNLYRGEIPASTSSWAYDHGTIDAARCGIATNSVTVPDRQDGRDSYYLVSMEKSGQEGGLGTASDAERPPASPACP